MIAGRELDALVAEKVMGWTPVMPKDGPKIPVWFIGNRDAGQLPRFSTDKAAAKEVIFAMLDRSDAERDRFWSALDFAAPEGIPRGDTPVWTDKVDPYDVCVAALKAVAG